jgi:hypothetical protein
MNLYIYPSKVMDRMQVNPTLDGVQEVIASAIEGAQLHIESVLDSKLTIQAYTDTFFLDSEAFSGIQPGGLFRLQLSSGFLRSGAAFTITSAASWNMVDAVSVDTSLYSVDLVRGLIYIDASAYSEKYVRVAFTAGFTPISLANDVTQLPAAEAMDWLQESILSYVPIIFDVSQTTNRNAEAEAQYRRAGDHAMAILAPYMRNSKGFTFRPLGV